MISDFCSKMKCKLLSVLKDVQPKAIESSTNVTSSTIEAFSDEHTAIEKDITININNPICEYAHGKRFKTTPTWIVVHYTGCANVSAKSICRAMRNNKNASSHFYIDENDICAAVPLKYIAWHVGDGQCKQPELYNKKTLIEIVSYKVKDWRYDLAAKNHLKWQAIGDDFVGNKCSLSVDICVKKSNKTSTKATDTDWYFEQNAIENLARTVAYLAKEYNINIDHIVRHCDCTGKLCPRPFVSVYDSENNDIKWEEFKSKVSMYMQNNISVKYI